MASVIMWLDDMRGGYVKICQEVLRHGVETSPRGLKTRELLDVTIELRNPADCMPIGVGRQLNTRIAAAEALQLIGGFSDPKMLVRTGADFSQFLEPDGTQWGAYGARIARQAEACERKLKADPDTRQAIITLWDPTRDNQPGRRDYPCTVMLGFMLRTDGLHMFTRMRSNDVYWGLAFDVAMFTALQRTLAAALDAPVASYHHNAMSLHAYERDCDAIEALHAPTSNLVDVAQPMVIGHPGDVLSERREKAKEIAVHVDGYPTMSFVPTQDELWYIERLAPR